MTEQLQTIVARFRVGQVDRETRSSTIAGAITAHELGPRA